MYKHVKGLSHVFLGQPGLCPHRSWPAKESSAACCCFCHETSGSSEAATLVAALAFSTDLVERILGHSPHHVLFCQINAQMSQLLVAEAPQKAQLLLLRAIELLERHH